MMLKKPVTALTGYSTPAIVAVRFDEDDRHARHYHAALVALVEPKC